MAKVTRLCLFCKTPLKERPISKEFSHHHAWCHAVYLRQKAVKQHGGINPVIEQQRKLKLVA